jgi:hypothetical protein
VKPTWWDAINAEWETAKANAKTFMGAYVPHTTPHMTGIAVYGTKWRELAPMLIQSPNHDAFDCYGAPQVLPHCHFTNLIQHVFRRHDPGWEVPHIGILDHRAVLFHQDKRGKLIAMLDQSQYNGDCAQHPMFGYTHLSHTVKVMRKFYYASNATKAFDSQGYRFVFSPLEPFGGAIPGVIATETQGEQIALDDLASNPATGISILSEADFEAVTKKKLPPPSSSTFEPLNKTSQKAALLPTPSQSPALLVAEPVPSASDPLPATEGIKDIASVIKVGAVEPSQTRVSPPSGRPRKAAPTA